jgi:hypothetical protein
MNVIHYPRFVLGHRMYLASFPHLIYEFLVQSLEIGITLLIMWKWSQILMYLGP